MKVKMSIHQAAYENKTEIESEINSNEVEPDLRLPNLKSRNIYLSRLNIENRIAEDEN